MKKRGRIQGVLAVTALLLTACGSSDSASADTRMMTESAAADVYEDYSYDNSVYFNEEAPQEYADAGNETEEAVDNSNRKLIRTANLDVETEQYDSLLANIEQQVKAMGGYVESISSYDRDGYYSYDSENVSRNRQASITARIPQNRLDEFLQKVGEEANVVSRSEGTEDVTLQYVDLESHKKALLTEQERLLELLEKAETVEDIITIESRLSEVRYQIESMESQLRTFDNKIDYSTVYLTIEEVEKYTPPADLSAGEKIRDGFMESLKGVGDGFANFGIHFVINLPYIVVWVLLIGIVFLVVRKIWKVSEKRQEKRRQQRAKNTPYGAAPAYPYSNQVNPYAGSPYPAQGQPAGNAPKPVQAQNTAEEKQTGSDSAATGQTDDR